MSSIAAPLQVKFCAALNESSKLQYEFVFCTVSSPDRGSHWYMDLPDHCWVLDPVYFKRQARYLNPSIIPTLRRLDADLLIFGGLKLPTVLLASLQYRWLSRKRCLFSEPPSRYPLTRSDLAWVRLLYGTPEYVFATGHQAADHFREIFPRAQVRNMPYPADIDINLRHAVRERVGAVKFLFSGRFVDANNPLLVLRTFLRLKSKHPEIAITFSGKGPLADRLMREAPADLVQSGAIRVLTQHTSWDDVWANYEGSDVLVLPRRFCGWGQVIPEAMASGMGIIAGAGVHAAKDLITPGEGGFLLQEPTSEELERAMLAYIENPGLITEHGRRNKVLAAHHTIAARAAEWNRFFEEVL